MYIESVMRAMNSHIFLVYMAKNNKTGYDTPLVHKNSRYIFLILERKSLMISSKKKSIHQLAFGKVINAIINRKKVKSLNHVQLFETPWTITSQAPLTLGFSRQEYWSWLPFPSPGDLLKPGIELRSPALQADALPSEPPGKPSCQ